MLWYCWESGSPVSYWELLHLVGLWSTRRQCITSVLLGVSSSVYPAGHPYHLGAGGSHLSPACLDSDVNVSCWEMCPTCPISLCHPVALPCQKSVQCMQTVPLGKSLVSYWEVVYHMCVRALHIPFLLCLTGSQHVMCSSWGQRIAHCVPSSW